MTEQTHPNFSAFTVRYKKNVSVLECNVRLCADDDLEAVEVSAFIDTGATISAISRDCATRLNSTPFGTIRLMGITGSQVVNEHIIDVEFPNGVKISTVRVAECDEMGLGMSGRHYGFIIGMDLIKFGDLSVNHADGYTSMSFRIPSLVHVDYVEEYNRLFPS